MLYSDVLKKPGRSALNDSSDLILGDHLRLASFHLEILKMIGMDDRENILKAKASLLCIENTAYCLKNFKEAGEKDRMKRKLHLLLMVEINSSSNTVLMRFVGNVGTIRCQIAHSVASKADHKILNIEDAEILKNMLERFFTKNKLECLAAWHLETNAFVSSEAQEDDELSRVKRKKQMEDEEKPKAVTFNKKG